MTDYVEAPNVTLDNDDPTLRDESVRAFLDAENEKAAALFARIGETDDEREQMQHYSDALVVVYRAGFVATRRCWRPARCRCRNRSTSTTRHISRSSRRATTSPPPGRSCSAREPRASSRETRGHRS